MIYGNLHRLGKPYEYPAPLFDILTALQAVDFEQLPFGSIDFVYEGVKLNYMEIAYANIEDAMSEIHKDYLDIQVSIDGQEVFGFAPDTHDNLIVEDRLDSDDIRLFSKMNKEVRIHSQPYDFFVFFPNDVHHGCCNVLDGTIRRAVVKVSVALLENKSSL